MRQPRRLQSHLAAGEETTHAGSRAAVSSARIPVWCRGLLCCSRKPPWPRATPVPCLPFWLVTFRGDFEFPVKDKAKLKIRPWGGKKSNCRKKKSWSCSGQEKGVVKRPRKLKSKRYSPSRESNESRGRDERGKCFWRRARERASDGVSGGSNRLDVNEHCRCCMGLTGKCRSFQHINAICEFTFTQPTTDWLLDDLVSFEVNRWKMTCINDAAGAIASGVAEKPWILIFSAKGFSVFRQNYFDSFCKWRFLLILAGYKIINADRTFKYIQIMGG